MAQESDISADEQDKIAAHRKAMEDRQQGRDRGSSPAAADGGMSESGEMPLGPMTDDQLSAELTSGSSADMPKPAMDRASDEQSSTVIEMPRPHMG